MESTCSKNCVIFIAVKYFTSWNSGGAVYVAMLLATMATIQKVNAGPVESILLSSAVALNRYWMTCDFSSSLYLGSEYWWMVMIGMPFDSCKEDWDKACETVDRYPGSAESLFVLPIDCALRWNLLALYHYESTERVKEVVVLFSSSSSNSGSGESNCSLWIVMVVWVR